MKNKTILLSLFTLFSLQSIAQEIPNSFKILYKTISQKAITKAIEHHLSGDEDNFDMLQFSISQTDKKTIKSWKPCDKKDLDHNKKMATLITLLNVSGHQQLAIAILENITNLQQDVFMIETCRKEERQDGKTVKTDTFGELTDCEYSFFDLLFIESLYVTKNFAIVIAALNMGFDFSEQYKKVLAQKAYKSFAEALYETINGECPDNPSAEEFLTSYNS